MKKLFSIFIIAVISIFTFADGIFDVFAPERIEPDKFIRAEKNIEITGAAFEFTFDKNSDQINLSSKLIVTRDNGRLIIKIPEEWKNKNKIVIIKIGTRNTFGDFNVEAASVKMFGNINALNYELRSSSTDINGMINVEKEMMINCSSLKISGKIKSENFKLKSSSTNLNAEFEIRNEFLLDCSSLKIDGRVSANNLKIKSSSANIDAEMNVKDIVFLNTAAFNGENIRITANKVLMETSSNMIKGEIRAKEIQIKSSSTNMDLKVSKSEKIEIDVSSLNGRIEYMDSWTGTRIITLNKKFKNFEIKTLFNNKGNLNKIYK